MLRPVSAAIVVLAVLAFDASGSEPDAEADTIVQKPRVLILQPVNLHDRTVVPGMTAELVQAFASTHQWVSFSRDFIEKKFQEYNKDYNKPCIEFSCAFELGEIVQAKYVLFSTMTPVQEDIYFNMNLIDISASKVVWSNAGQVPAKAGGNTWEAVERRVRKDVSKIQRSDFNLAKAQNEGVLGILDLSPPSDNASVLLDRLTTQAYMSGRYTLVGQSELDFLIQALDIQKSEIRPTKENLIPLGEKLGIDYMIFSRLRSKVNSFDLQLALYDIKKKELLREWPLRSSNFRKILDFEDKFSSSLQQKVSVAGTAQPAAKSRGSKLTVLKWVVNGLLFAASGTTGYLAYREQQNSDREFDRWQHALSLDQRAVFQQNVKNAEEKRNLYGGISAGTGFSFLVSIIIF